jgi:lipoyl synthase
MSGTFRAYFVWPQFPSISMTGSACQLDCLHCNRVYLKHMEGASTPELLVETCKAHKERGAKGVLISGGCDKEGGMLNLERFIPAIKEVHDMGLIIKLHTGLMDERMARLIAGAGVDIASQEIVGDAGTVKEMFGLDTDLARYFTTFKYLHNAGVPFLCPHLCVGLHFGKMKGELKALDMMKESFVPSTLAVIVFRPTKGTKLADSPAPDPRDLGVVVRRARELFPKTKIILGALRPRSSTRNDPNKQIRYGLETEALEAGVDGMEVPSNEIMDQARRKGMRIKRIEAYGVLPIDYEDRVETSWME